MTIIYLDLDGVIVDFMGGLLRHKKITHLNKANWPFGIYELEDILGIPEDEIWQGLDDLFWFNLEKTPWADELLKKLEPYKPIILSAPPRSGGTCGKINWIETQLPEYYHAGRFILTKRKDLLAAPGTLLIDDSEKKCKEFMYHGKAKLPTGAETILFPAFWNRNYIYADNPLSYTFGKLNVILS